MNYKEDESPDFNEEAYRDMMLEQTLNQAQSLTADKKTSKTAEDKKEQLRSEYFEFHVDHKVESEEENIMRRAVSPPRCNEEELINIRLVQDVPDVRLPRFILQLTSVPYPRKVKRRRRNKYSLRPFEEQLFKQAPVNC